MSGDAKARILGEIRRYVEANNGIVPGKLAFKSATGISEASWSGRHWARWSDALREAGFEPNARSSQIPEQELMTALALLVRRFGRFPVKPEFRIAKLELPDLPSYDAYIRRFGGTEGLIAAFRSWCVRNTNFADLVNLLPAEAFVDETSKNPPRSGWVYLTSYGGGKYKIGFSMTPNQRLGNLDRNTPETLVEIWRIEIDDPSGIEKYWHIRFADQAIKNEFFNLSKSDVAAFKRWRKIY